MTTVAILSHKEIAHELSILGEWLRARGYEYTRFYREDTWNPDDLLSSDLVIILGSPRSTATGFEHKDSNLEIELTQKCIAGDKHFLGICYGAQILGKAVGGEVLRRESANVGYKLMDIVGPHFGIEAGAWMLWHEDMVEFESLPEAVEVIGTSEGAVVAFRAGRAVGVQFHPEVDGDSLGRMIAGLGISEERWGPVRDALNADEQGHRARAFSLFDSVLDLT